MRLENSELAPLTTLGVGGCARELWKLEEESDLPEMIEAARTEQLPLMVLGGGSNVVFSDAGFPGVVLHMALAGENVSIDEDEALLEVAAGENWAERVDQWVADGLSGVECLAGIPGLIGATPVQNVGAYGQEISQVLVSLRAWDRLQNDWVHLDAAQCQLAYRTSSLKGTERYVVTSVTLRLRRDNLSRPIAYKELARTLGVEIGKRVPVDQAHAAVLDLRRSKAMVLDPFDPDTRSAGSFFTNPVLNKDQMADLEVTALAVLGPDISIPSFPNGDKTKVSAAWLIERSGFSRGYRDGAVGLSGKHTLAITTTPGARADDVIRLARTIQKNVESVFHVRLTPEPVLVGLSLD